MKIIEIEGLFQMDIGAPSPLIISNDNNVFIAFYELQETDFTLVRDISEIHMRDEVHDAGIIIIKFIHPSKHLFGSPNDEAISGHPYYKLGMSAYAFYELKGSDKIHEIQKIGMVHPYYNPAKWSNIKHYILTFKEGIFECLAEGFEIRRADIPITQIAPMILDEIFHI